MTPEQRAAMYAGNRALDSDVQFLIKDCFLAGAAWQRDNEQSKYEQLKKRIEIFDEVFNAYDPEAKVLFELLLFCKELDKQQPEKTK